MHCGAVGGSLGHSPDAHVLQDSRNSNSCLQEESAPLSHADSGCARPFEMLGAAPAASEARGLGFKPGTALGVRSEPRVGADAVQWGWILLPMSLS